MQTRKNPILIDKLNPTFNLETLKSPVIHKRKVQQKKRELRDCRRAENAAESIKGWDKGLEIFGFTKSQFSLIDLITTVIGVTGPAEMFISTWTAANTDITRILNFVSSGVITQAKWLVDFTFQRRTPELAQRIRDVFGCDAIRVAKNHAKYVILKNCEYDVIIQTSMNLNYNPRFENFTLSNDTDLVDFLLRITNEIWEKQKRSLADATPGEFEQYFKTM
ncbi:MAG: hypothetical protein GY839_05325 [candidate division Zixibacteria bacterium]|nr:hypothetical protein [candidate division Zixibacteria bacterium]